MMFFTQSGKDKKSKQQQASQKYLSKVTTALDLISKVYEPTTIYTKLWYYTQSKDQNIKQPFRVAVEQIFARMNKKESLIKNLKEIIRKQKMYNQAIMEKLDPVYHYEQKDFVRNSDLLEKIGKVSRKDQQSYMKGWKIDPTLQQFFVEFNRVKRKYDLFMKAIKSYRRSINPHFQAGIQNLNEEFQNQQVSEILGFDDQLNRGLALKIKDMVTSQTVKESLAIIHKALKQIQNASDFMQLDRILYKYKSQIVNYKLFESFIRNQKERIKLLTILKNLKRFMTDDISQIQQIFTQIDCDVDLNPYYKIITHQIVSKLLEMRKCQVLFSKYLIKMNFKQLSSFVEYFEQMANAVRQSLEEIQGYHLTKNKQSQNFADFQIPKQPNNKTNIFHLMKYFKKLLEYIKSPLNNNNQLNNNIDAEIGSVSIQEAIKEKNRVCQKLKQRLEVEEKKNQLLNKHIHKLNTELKRIKIGEQDKNEEGFLSFGSQEEIENKQDDERETEKMFAMRKQHQKEVRSLEQRIRQLQQENTNKSRLLQQYQQNSKDLKKCGMEEQQRNSILSKVKQLQQEKQKYEIAKVEADIKNSQIIEQDTFRIRQLQQKVQELSKKLENSQRDREQLKDKFDQHQSQNQQKLDKLIQQLSCAKAMGDKLVLQINLIQAQKSTLTEQIREKEDNLGQLVRQNEKLNAEIIELKKMEQKFDQQGQQENKNLNAEIIELRDSFQKMEQKFDKQGQENKKLNYNLKLLEQQRLRIMTLKNNAQQTIKTSLLFHGQILTSPNNQPLKHQLLSEISKTAQSDIKQTSLIYRIDNKNKTNPHEYIDNISNWIAMWELKTGYIVGAYCPSSYQMGGIVKEGFMFSFNCKINQIKVYRLLGKYQKARIYTYEDHYFIIGNSEIRYKFLENNLEHCFGSNYRYFDTGKQKTIDFFGSQQSEIQLVQFEFHSIKFE